MWGRMGQREGEKARKNEAVVEEYTYLQPESQAECFKWCYVAPWFTKDDVMPFRLMRKISERFEPVKALSIMQWSSHHHCLQKLQEALNILICPLANTCLRIHSAQLNSRQGYRMREDAVVQAVCFPKDCIRQRSRGRQRPENDYDAATFARTLGLEVKDRHVHQPPCVCALSGLL
jgi:hypothetical protein